MTAFHVPPSILGEKSKEASGSRALILVIIGGIALVGLSWFFALRPAFSAYRAFEGESVQELNDRLSLRRTSLAKLTSIAVTFSSITPEEREKLSAVLPNEAGTADLIANMEELVRVSGLTLISVDVQAPEEVSAPIPAPASPGDSRVPPGVRVVSISLKAKGLNYFTLKQFLQRIETNVRLLDVPALSFTSGGEDVNVTLLTYTYRPPQLTQDVN